MSRLASSGAVACLAACLAFSGFLFGCSQGFGERCQQNSDCSSGFCSTNVMPQTAKGGVCCASATDCPGVGETDGSTGVDAAEEAGSPDGPDASVADAPADAVPDTLGAEPSDDATSADGPPGADAADAADGSDDTMSADASPDV